MNNWKTAIKMTMEVLLAMAVLWLGTLSVAFGLIALSESIINGTFLIFLGIGLYSLAIFICHDLARETRILVGRK